MVKPKTPIFQTPKYRIKWRWVDVCNGRASRKEFRCLAERRYSFLGLSIWFPFEGADWRSSRDVAIADIEADIERRQTLPRTEYFA